MTATIILQNVYLPIKQGTGRFEAGAWSERQYERSGEGTFGHRAEIMETVGYWKITVPVMYDWEATFLPAEERWACRHENSLARLRGEFLPLEGFNPEEKSFVENAPYMAEGYYDKNRFYFTAIKRVKEKNVNPRTVPDRNFEKFFTPAEQGGYYGDGPSIDDFVEKF